MKLKITEQEKKDILEQYQEDEILTIPGFSFFNYDWKVLMSFLNKRGNPKWKMMGNLSLYDDQDVTDLNNLVSVEGYLSLVNTPLTTLGVLESVGGNLDLKYSKIESLGALESVGGKLDLMVSKIESLGNLKMVGGVLYLFNTPISKKYTENEIRQMVKVGGGILM